MNGQNVNNAAISGDDVIVDDITDPPSKQDFKPFKQNQAQCS